MAIISTSPNYSTEFALRIHLLDASNQSSEKEVYPLFERQLNCSQIDFAGDACVREYGKYSLDFLSRHDLGEIHISLTLDGESYIQPKTRRVNNYGVCGAAEYFRYECDLDEGNQQLFQMVLGFVSIGVIITTESKDEIYLCTRDIPCLCRKEDQERAISGMLQKLLDEQSSVPMQWMLYPSHEANNSRSFIDGSISDTSRTTRSFISLVESVFDAFERELPYFRSMPYCRTEKKHEVIDAKRARQVGSHELIWIAKNPQHIRSASDNYRKRIAAGSVVPDKIQTRVMRRSLDNMENRSVLSFLNAVVDSIIETEAKAQFAIHDLLVMKSKLEKIDCGESLLLPLEVMRACIALEEPLVGKLKTLRQMGFKLKRMYESALPGVRIERYQLPKRTKAFQEIRQYLHIYRLMEKWNHFGDFEMLRDGVILGITRMDKLYEYYALAELLSWLHDEGFVLNHGVPDPLSSIMYSIDDPRFHNEKTVSNRYSLIRNGERVTLYYQPVIYGDNREEGGITLHRTTPRCPFMHQNLDSYWTPDFLIEFVDSGGATHVFVLDAKFRTIDSVVRRYAGNPSCFSGCLQKYKNEIAGSVNDIECVWLLCGRESRINVETFQSSSWAISSYARAKDGVVAVSPRSNDIDALFSALGISSSVVVGRVDTSKGKQDKSPHEIYKSEGGVFQEGDLGSRSETVLVDVEDASASQGSDNLNNNLENTYLDETVSVSPSTDNNDIGSEVHIYKRHKAEIPADVLSTIRDICQLTVDKTALFDSSSSATAFGFSHPLLRKSPPSGRERRLYTSEPVDVEGDKLFVYRQWRPLNKIKLKSLQRSLRKDRKI